MSTTCQLPTSNQVGGPWSYITGVNEEGCPVFLTCVDIADCLPETPESPAWDGSSPDGSVSITNDGAGSSNLGHTPDITVNIAGGATCPDNALGLATDGLCVPRGANALTTNFITGSGTTADPIRLDNCAFGSIPVGTSVTHLGISIAGCLVQDVIPSFNETNWIGISGDGVIDVANGGTVGHGPTFSLNIADSADCPNNILSAQASGLCAQETPLVVTSNDGTVTFTQSGTSDHELDLSVLFTETDWTGTPIDDSLTITNGGTFGHAPMIGVNIADVADCPGNILSLATGGLCVQETPLIVTSDDGSVTFTQSGTADHAVDLSVVETSWTATTDSSITVVAGGTSGHDASFSVDIADSTDCPDNLLSLTASGLCVQETPLTITSNDGSVIFTQSGIADHTLDLSVVPPANTPLVVSSPNGSISFTQSGTDDHTLALDVDICNLGIQAGTAMSFVGIAADGCLVTDTVSNPAETPWVGTSSNTALTVTNGGTVGHGPVFAVNVASAANCPNNMIGIAADGLCVQPLPLTVGSSDGTVVVNQSGTAGYTIDLTVPSGAETPLTLSSPNGTVSIAQSGTAAHTATLDVDWCASGANIPSGTIGSDFLGIDAGGCVVKGPAGFFAQSSGSNDFIPLGSNYDVEIDYDGTNGTAINGQPVFNAATNTLHFPLIADDDYRRISDVGPTYKSFTEADQAWRTGDVVWGDSAIQPNTKGDFRGNVNVGPLTNTVTSGQFTLSQGGTNTNSGLYSHTRGIANSAIGLYSFAGGDGSVASGAVAAFALGVVETAGGGWAGPTQAIGDGGFAVGRGAQANNEWSVAMGRAVQANGAISTGFGSFILLDGDLSGAVGRAQTTTANGVAGFLGGGFDNTVDALGAGIIGSANGLITGSANFSLLHGNNNTINNGGSSFISGDGNTIDCFGTSFAQGRANNIVNPNGNTEASGAIGRENTVAGEQCYAIGRDNLVDGFHCLAQGQNNTVIGNRGAAFGQDNFINNADVGTVIGSNNTLNVGVVDGIAMGEGNTLDGQNTVGIGKDTNVVHAGAILISATTNAFPVFSSTNTEQFAVRAAGGIRMTTNGTATSGAFLNPGGSFWGAISAREAKDDIEEIGEGFGALDRVRNLPLYLFRYGDEDKGVRNLGPMADEWEQVVKGTGLENKVATVKIASRRVSDTVEHDSVMPNHSEDRRARPSHGDGGRRDRNNYSQKSIGRTERRQPQYEDREVVTISPNDMSALALSAIQEMAQRIEELEAKLSACCDDSVDNGKKKQTNRRDQQGRRDR